MDKPALYFIVPFCSIFIAVGAWLMLKTGHGILLGIQAGNWPTTTGKLLSVKCKDTSDSETTSREIQVRYSYNVGGRDYEGTTIHPAYGSSGLEQAHQGLESLLAPGQNVRVYYDESEPSRSTLSVGLYSCSLAGFFGGLIFAASGLAFLLTFWFAIAGDFGFAKGITVIR
jgi:hypothetical protein